MHEWFTASIAAARQTSARDRADRHRTRVAIGTDLRTRVVAPILDAALEARRRLELRRADASGVVVTDLARPRHA